MAGASPTPVTSKPSLRRLVAVRPASPLCPVAFSTSTLTLAGAWVGSPPCQIRPVRHHLVEQVVHRLRRHQVRAEPRVGVRLGRDRDQVDVLRLQVHQRLGQVQQVGDRLEVLVYRQRLGRDVRDLVEPGDVAEQALMLDLLRDRGDKGLLQLDARQVAAGVHPAADAVPGPDVGQRLVVGQLVQAGGQVQVRVAVVVAGTGRDTDRDAADGIHHRPERVEVEYDHVVELDPGQCLHGLDRTGGAADVERAVDDGARRVALGRPDAGADVRALLAGRLVDEQVPWDRQHGRVRVRRVQVHQQQVVGVGRARVGLVTEEAVLALAFLRAQHEDVEGAVDGAAGQPADLDRRDVALEVVVHGVRAHAGYHREHSADADEQVPELGEQALGPELRPVASSGPGPAAAGPAAGPGAAGPGAAAATA